VFGTLLLGFLGLLVHLIRAHRDRWRAFLISFLQHEGVIALEVLGELWDICGTPTLVHPEATLLVWMRSLPQVIALRS
jgi:hypothetical protein